MFFNLIDHKNDIKMFKTLPWNHSPAARGSTWVWNILKSSVWSKRAQTMENCCRFVIYVFTLYVSILGGKMTGYKPQEPSLGIQYSIWPVRTRFLHSYMIHFFTTSNLLSQPGVISNSPPKRVVFLMKFKFYRKASKCGLDSPTLLTTVLVNSLTFIIAVLQPNVRTKRRKTNRHEADWPASIYKGGWRVETFWLQREI